MILTQYSNFYFCARQCIKCGDFKPMKESVCSIISDLESSLGQGYQIKIKPSDFRSNIKLHMIVITMISQNGKEQTIRVMGIAETQAVKEFIESHSELKVIDG